MAVTVASQGLMNSSLYVGDLHPRVSDSALQAKFSEIGPVLSARVCRDLATRQSLGYGYVNFEDPKHAEQALEVLNYEPLMGRPIRIMWSQRDPSLRKSGKGNIFIKNLDKSIEQKELYDTFSFFGRILSCKIVMDENGQSKGYGFVHFEKEECAERAIEKINNMIIRDRVVYVGKFIPKTERKSQARKVKFNNLYVKNFPPETDNEKLKEMFSEFGEIKSACVMKDNEGKSKGFGFVCYLDPDHAENAVRTMHGKEIEGRVLYCARAQRKEERQEELKQKIEKQRAERQSNYMLNVNLYVKNLDDNIDDKRLEEAFSVHGSITSAKVMKDANNRSKGFGFVCFANPEQAARAVTDMNGTIIGSKPLYVALAQRKEDRRAKLIEEHQQRLAQYRAPVASMIPAVPGHAAPHNYFPPAFQAQRFYHPSSAVLSSQPRWNRAAGIPAQIGAIPNRPPVAGYYPGAPNPAAITANQMAAFAQLRTPGVNRPMMPNGMSSMPTTPHLQTAAVFNQAANQQRQATGRQGVVVPQVLGATTGGLNQRPTAASVVAGPPSANPTMRPQVASQVPRAVMHSGMPNITNATTNVRFHQTARNVSAQPTLVPTGNTSTLLSPLGDQGQLTISALAQLSEVDQKRALGEHLFPRIQTMYPTLARKLTGMLLGVDNAEVINLLESDDLLRAKCEEGISVLESSQNQQNDIATSAGQNGDGSTTTGSIKPEDSNN
ncbi:Embryonic polyadenylate-binding protein isoform 2 [Schistosoma japonicum]|uniref:Polyadenylate-binding protein n=1 Tax=Schistosoma japonicum TaxID=6182 RepID=Q5DA36_SCHJA|nr:SJCHGC06322 protein [Schistosoma japonicum]TNN14125.1 Embryonic polyadenylate-binding protein isoform 2 [Schistosoma japonicum]